LAEEMYKKTAETAEAEGGPDQAASGGGDEGVVDADFEEVK
jgi:hypothetical protein